MCACVCVCMRVHVHVCAFACACAGVRVCVFVLFVSRRVTWCAEIIPAHIHTHTHARTHTSSLGNMTVLLIASTDSHVVSLISFLFVY